MPVKVAELTERETEKDREREVERERERERNRERERKNRQKCDLQQRVKNFFSLLVRPLYCGDHYLLCFRRITHLYLSPQEDSCSHTEREDTMVDFFTSCSLIFTRSLIGVPSSMKSSDSTSREPVCCCCRRRANSFSMSLTANSALLWNKCINTLCIKTTSHPLVFSQP